MLACMASSEVFSFSSDSYPPYVLLLELKGDDGILVCSGSTFCSIFLSNFQQCNCRTDST